VYTGEDVVEEFGVEASSYEAVPLLNIRAYQAPCAALGNPVDVLELNTEAIPKALGWGEARGCWRAPRAASGLTAAQGAGGHARHANQPGRPLRRAHRRQPLHGARGAA